MTQASPASFAYILNATHITRLPAELKVYRFKFTTTNPPGSLAFAHWLEEQYPECFQRYHNRYIQRGTLEA